ncbi:MAG: hypothetical protein V7K47_22205 [Nostoc sp.]
MSQAPNQSTSLISLSRFEAFNVETAGKVFFDYFIIIYKQPLISIPSLPPAIGLQNLNFQPLNSKVAPFYSNVEPLNSEVAPFYSNIELLNSEVAPFCWNVEPLNSEVAPFCWNVEPLNSEVAPFYSNVEPLNLECRAFNSSIQFLSFNVAPQKCNYRAIFYNAAF